MGFFPLFVDLSGRRVLIVGGGTVAERKIRALLGFGAAPLVVSPQVTDEVRRLANTGAVRFFARKYRPGDLAGAALAVAATNDREVNRAVSRDARKREIPVNVVDDPELCTFYFPAIVRRGDFVVGISTSGSYPALAKYARSRIEKTFPESCGEILEKLKWERLRAMREIPDPEERKKELDRLLREAIGEKAAPEGTEKETCNGDRHGRH